MRMRKALYFKFILAYLIFAFFGVFMIATFGATMIRNQIVQHEADALYKEANRIANTYASDLYTNRAALDTVKQQLDCLPRTGIPSLPCRFCAIIEHPF